MVPIERVEEELHELLEAGGDRLLAVAAVSCSRRGERLVVLHLSHIAGRLGVAFDRLRGRGLPNLWVPDVRDCHEVETFPVLGTGKLDLRGLGELAKKLAS
jgi:acyl-[acyl-carrier-protein]-phospholipid O-acyltransferase/long-chain-fatty-acid--[acyl-carrier-protein] ligase